MSMHNEILARIKKERKSVAKLYGNSSQSVTEERVCEIVWNILPNKVLSHPGERYLDYACGKGSILLYGIELLFVKLRNKIPDPAGRLYHIVYNQIFGTDISKPQIDIARSSIKRILGDPSALINIDCANSLIKKFDMKKKFNLVTNVPFQNGKDTQFHLKFRNELNGRLKDILNYKVMVSPNYLTMTARESNTEHLAVYIDLGNAFKSITLPAGVCVTREDPTKTTEIQFTDLKGNTSIVNKEDFVVLADSSASPIIKKIMQSTTLATRYIHDSNKIDLKQEVKNGTVFYIDKAGETNKDVKGFYVDENYTDVRSGCFLVFAYNAPGDPLDVGNKKLGPVKVLKKGKYLFSGSVVALRFDSVEEAENCKSMLDSEWSKNIIKAVKYATNNSKSLLNVLPNLDFTKKFKESDARRKFG